MRPFSLAIRGGAGTLTRGMMTPEKESSYLEGINAALEAGYSILEKGASATEAVAEAVISLENCPLFNAGKGSVLPPREPMKWMLPSWKGQRARRAL